MTTTRTIETFERAFPLEDIAIRADGTGRTVEAYAAVFNRTSRVKDWYWLSDDGYDEYGVYDELIRSGAFTKTINERRLDFQSLFNHGKSIHGMPSDRFSMPLGTPLEVKQDSKGLLTVTRYAKTPHADEVLELIDAGAIRSFSFGGKMINSKLTKATRQGDVDLVERLEISLKEYGPCVFPAYKDATIVGVRAEDLAAQLSQLSPEERRDLIRILDTGTQPEAGRQQPATSQEAPPEPNPTDTPPGAGSQEPPAEGPSLSSLELDVEMRRRRASL